MDTFEFQNESVLSGSPWDTADLNDATRALSSRDPEQITLLMLGLSRRGWLTESEMAWLDSIAPADHLTFLVQGDRYLHPHELPLFPLELIDAAVTQGGMAQFSHRYRPQKGAMAGQTYEIRTAVIGENSAGPMVLGLFGPELPIHTDCLDQYFGEVTGRFREAFSLADRLNRAADTTWVDSRAELLLAGREGRVVDLSPHLREILPGEETRLVGRNFDQLESLLAELVPGRRLSLRNIDHTALPMTILSLASNREIVAGEPSSGASAYLDDLLERLHQISAAAEDLGDSVYADKSLEELRYIDREAGALIDRISDLKLLLDFELLPTGRVDLSAVLVKAAEAVDPWLIQSGRLVIENTAGQHFVTAPESALVVFLKTVLESHLARCNWSGTITVTMVAEPPVDPALCFVSDTGGTGKTCQFAALDDFARRLADKLDISMIDSETPRICRRTKLNFKADRI